MKRALLWTIRPPSTRLRPVRLNNFTRVLRALIATLLLHSAVIHAQPVVDWLKTGGTAQGDDRPGQLVRGRSGEFYLTGLFGAPDGSSAEAVLFKLDSAGNEIARQPWQGAYAHAVAVGPNGE